MSIEDFKKLHSELGQTLKDYEINEQKRNEHAQEILNEMHDIAKESEHAADAAHDVSKKLRLRKILFAVLAALLFLIGVVDKLVRDENMRFVIICILLVLVFSVVILRRYFKPFR